MRLRSTGRRPAGVFGLLLSLSAFALGAGCNPVTTLVERSIERELPRLIGPAARYTVEIEGLRAGTGEAERVHVVGEGVRPEDAPYLHRVDLYLVGVRYDRQTRRLTRADSAGATITVRPSDLMAFLEGHRNIREAVLTLQSPDGATLRLRPSVGGLALPPGVSAELRGRLTSTDGRLAFEVADVRAAGLSLGRVAARRLSSTINPLVDLTGTAIRLRITHVRAEPGTLRIDATGDPTRLGRR